jgi:hypothetical protein
MSSSDGAASSPEVVSSSPAITALPTGDELVINLPEGQKVVLGKLPPGTVIEIASWRGTGPPDSHTARILLSTTPGGAVVQSPLASEVPVAVESKASKPTRAEKKRAKQEAAKPQGPRHRKRMGAGAIIVIVMAVIATAAVGTLLTLAILQRT